jgi:hypothetical protein
VRNHSDRTIEHVRAELVSYRRAEWLTAMPSGLDLVEVRGRSRILPGETLEFRLVGWDRENEYRAVSFAPGSGNPFGAQHWLPRGKYLMRVKVFGDGVLPDEDGYEIDFPNQTSVSFGRTIKRGLVDQMWAATISSLKPSEEVSK